MENESVSFLSRKMEKFLFWAIVFALFLSLMTNETERIENSQKIQTLERTMNVYKKPTDLLMSKEEIQYILWNHTHYYNGKAKPENEWAGK